MSPNDRLCRLGVRLLAVLPLGFALGFHGVGFDRSQEEALDGPRLGQPSRNTPVQADGRDVESPGTDEVLATARPEAVAAWLRMLAASHPAAASPGVGDGQVTPAPNSFHLEAEVVTRDGSSTNQLDVDYSFLSPHFVRFLLPSNRQTGRGPSGKGLSSYWLKDGEKVQRLDTRENKEDRRLVKEMTALARNFLALTDPDRIRLSRLDLLEGPPVELPRVVRGELASVIRRAARALEETGATPTEGAQDTDLVADVVWIRLQTPDFDLVRREGEARDARRDQLVSLAIGPRGLPLVAVVQDPRSSRGGPLEADASLILLGAWVRDENDHYITPRWIRVFRPEPVPLEAPTPDAPAQAWAFGKRPVQDITLKKADLHPNFVPTDFDP